MRILYGVVGEGMGHAIRSRVVLEHLRRRGHTVKIVVSGRAYAFLAKLFDDVVEIKGFPIVYEGNAVDRDKTALTILMNAASWALDNAEAYQRDVRHFGADAVITDFDSFAHLYGLRHRIPVISIDNQHAITRLQHDEDVTVVRDDDGRIIHDYRRDFELAKNVVRAKLAGAAHRIVTTFFFPPVRDKYLTTTTLVPPILRPEILAAKARAERRDHVLVYQTSAAQTSLLDALAQLDGEFRVYGFIRPDAPRPKGEPEGDDVRFAKNVLVRSFSERGFIDDLASSRAVVTGGGFTVLGESVYLGKPIFSIPVEHHFEQIVSARYVEKLGYGEHHESFQAAALTRFLGRADRYARALEGYHQDGNQALEAAVDATLARLVPA